MSYECYGQGKMCPTTPTTRVKGTIARFDGFKECSNDSDALVGDGQGKITGKQTLAITKYAIKGTLGKSSRDQHKTNGIHPHIQRPGKNAMKHGMMTGLLQKCHWIAANKVRNARGRGDFHFLGHGETKANMQQQTGSRLKSIANGQVNEVKDEM